MSIQLISDSLINIPQSNEWPRSKLRGIIKLNALISSIQQFRLAH